MGLLNRTVFSLICDQCKKAIEDPIEVWEIRRVFRSGVMDIQKYFCSIDCASRSLVIKNEGER